MYKLVIADEEGSTTVVPLVREEITVGRKEGNTIRLTERNVSRQHAVFRKQEGAYSVQDMDSYNGVRVNGKKIDHETLLKVGDQVGVGDYLLALQQAAAESAAATSSGPPPAPGTASAKPARLVMLSPPAAGAEFSLAAQVVRFGRGEDQDAWVNHRSMSREHAEVRRTADGHTVHDLSSSNGVRVNGTAVLEAGLEPGDVVEFGRVRFRYVGVGEDYTFDADRTIQMAAYTLPTRGSSAPLIAAFAILVVAGGIAMAILTDDDSDSLRVASAPAQTTGAPEPNAAPADDPAPSVEAVAEPEGPTQGEQAQAAVEACRASLGSLEAAAAVQHADRALEMSAGLASAVQCRGEASELIPQQERFNSGNSALAAGDAVQAVAMFDLLPADSPYRSRPELATAAQQLRTDQLAEGAAAVADSRWDDAEGLAQSVLESGATGDQANQARSLRTDARTGRDREEAAAVAAVIPRTRPEAPRARPAASRNPDRRPGQRSPMTRPVQMSSPPPVVEMAQMAASPSTMATNILQLCLGMGSIPSCACRMAARGNGIAVRYVQASGLACGR